MMKRYLALKIFTWWRNLWGHETHDARIDYPCGPFGRTVQ